MTADPIIESLDRHLAAWAALERQLDTLPPPTPEQAKAVIAGWAGVVSQLVTLARAVAVQNAELEARLAQIIAATGQRKLLS